VQNFFGFHQKSRGSRRYLGVEVVLDRTEAFFAVSLPIALADDVHTRQFAGFAPYRKGTTVLS
jgi:hypothetical protein